MTKEVEIEKGSIIKAQKQIVEELKTQWKLMWSERFNDKEKAEGVATTDYQTLYIDQGTIIQATKDYKAPSFREILEKRFIENSDRYLPVDTAEGGWHRFIRKEICSSKPKSKRISDYLPQKNSTPQPKSNKRGWLHVA